MYDKPRGLEQCTHLRYASQTGAVDYHFHLLESKRVDSNDQLVMSSLLTAQSLGSKALWSPSQ